MRCLTDSSIRFMYFAAAFFRSIGWTFFAAKSSRSASKLENSMLPPCFSGRSMVIVGYFMMTLVREIDWSDPGIGIPALLTIVVMPFTYSITNGIGAGFISYVLLKAFAGRAKEVAPLMYAAALAFLVYFVIV